MTRVTEHELWRSQHQCVFRNTHMWSAHGVWDLPSILQKNANFCDTDTSCCFSGVYWAWLLSFTVTQQHVRQHTLASQSFSLLKSRTQVALLHARVFLHFTHTSREIRTHTHTHTLRPKHHWSVYEVFPQTNDSFKREHDTHTSARSSAAHRGRATTLSWVCVCVSEGGFTFPHSPPHGANNLI